MSQSQCGWPSSQTSYASSAWWAVTRTNYLIRNRPHPGRLTPLSPKPCGFGMSSGITRPFGRLSRAPGHVSDSLLTRPPLDRIATAPYDLHVLATPPAFRLSQDQTLQLDFVTPTAPRPAVTPGPFRGGVVLETSLSPTRRARHPAGGTSAPRRQNRGAYRVPPVTPEAAPRGGPAAPDDKTNSAVQGLETSFWLNRPRPAPPPALRPAIGQPGAHSRIDQGKITSACAATRMLPSSGGRPTPTAGPTGRLSPPRPTDDRRPTPGISVPRTPPYTGGREAHTLAAFRLFTYQRTSRYTSIFPLSRRPLISRKRRRLLSLPSSWPLQPGRES